MIVAAQVLIVGVQYRPAALNDIAAAYGFANAVHIDE